MYHRISLHYKVHPENFDEGASRLSVGSDVCYDSQTDFFYTHKKLGLCHYLDTMWL